MKESKLLKAFKTLVLIASLLAALIVIIHTLFYAMLNPELTQVQVILGCWHYWVSGIVLVVLAVLYNETETKTKEEKLANKIIKSMQKAGLNPDQMLEVIRLAKEKYNEKL